MRDKHSTQLSQLERLINEVDTVTNERGAPAVGAFLAHVMTGQDPRPIESPLFQMVKTIAFREFAPKGGAAYPTEEEWALIVAEVLGSGLYERAPVPIEQSQKAAEKLIDYLHAKMKAVEVKADISARVEITPLTGEDYDEFMERFDSEYG